MPSVKENKERIKSQLQVRDTLTNVSIFSSSNKKKKMKKKKREINTIYVLFDKSFIFIEMDVVVGFVDYYKHCH